MKKSFLVLPALMIVGAFGIACGTSEDETQSCANSAECTAGMVCQTESGTCVERPCNNVGDCVDPINEVCVAADLLGMTVATQEDQDGNLIAYLGYCTAIKCTDQTGTMPCPTGQACENGWKCVDSGTVDDVIEDTTGTDTTERPDGEAPADIASGTDEGQTTDIGPLPTEDNDCMTCTTDADCGDGYKCLPVGSEKHCLRNCATDKDCESGYICYAASSNSQNCLPVSYNCVACAFDSPCEDGKCCNFANGACTDCQSLCSACTYDYECEEGMRCYKVPGEATGACVPECPEGNCEDSTNFTCGENAKGVPVCIPKDPDSCGGCSDPTPFPLNGTCVECTQNSHCESDQACDIATHTCKKNGSGCPTGTKDCGDGSCKQCCQNNDCTADWCDGATGVCLADGTCEGCSDACQGMCGDQFPICTVINGIAQCVQCQQDADCAFLDPLCHCSGDPTYACLTDSGSVCQGSVCPAVCTSDADCPPDTSGNALSCNVVSASSGFCYNPSGSCDGVTACCAPGQECFDIMSLLMGGLGGGGLPTGTGETMMGVCSCDDDHACLGGKTCTDPQSLCAMPFIGDMLCAGGSLTGAPEGICFDIADLLGGII